MARFVTEQISEADAAIIAGLLERHGHPGMLAVELGTYTGRSALAMLPTIARHDGHLFCVDWFRGNVGVEAEIGPSYRTHDILQILRENLTASGYSDHVSILLSTTLAAARLVADRSLDVLFIDADHRYSAVKADLSAWLPKMKPGALVFGHDFERPLRDMDPASVAAHGEEDFFDGCHLGVIRAVCEAFPNVGQLGRLWWTLAAEDRAAA